MEKPNWKPSAKPSEKTSKIPSALKNMSGVIVDELVGVQKTINKIPSALKEVLSPGKVRTFFEKVFGKQNKVSSFLSLVTSTLAEKFEFLNKVKMPWDEFENQLKTAAEKVSQLPFNLKEFIVAHRALGYGRYKENSKEALMAAMRKGEKQIEIDLRRGIDGKIYLAHDSIKNVQNPQKHFTSLAEALKTIAEDENQDVVIFFDIKEKGIVDEMDKMIEGIDKKFKSKEYIPIAEKHFVMGFNFKTLKLAKKLRKNRPLIFCYIPVHSLKGFAEFIKRLGQRKMMGICKVIDKFSGGHLAEDLSKTCVTVDGEKLDETNEMGDTFLGIFTELPSDEILKTVNYICVPAILAGAELVKKAHNKGVNVAVWGASESHIQKMIVEVGADLVISDKPDIDV